MKKRFAVLAFSFAALSALVFCSCKLPERPPADGGGQSEKKVTVSFNLNYEPSPAPPESKEVTVGQPYGTLPAPEREDYEFSGWFFRDGVEQAAKGTVVTREINHTVFAKWTGEGGPEPWIPPEEKPDWDVDPELYPQYEIPVYKKGVKMPIGAWEPYIRTSSGAIASQSAFNDAANAGFTFLMPLWLDMDFGSDKERGETIMARASAAGLKVMVQDTKLTQSNSSSLTNRTSWDTSRVQFYKDSPAFMGLYIYDEPHATDSWGNAGNGNTAWINNRYGWIAEKRARFDETFGAKTDKEFYITLLPPVQDSVSGDTSNLSFFGTSWVNYMQKFLDMGASWLSFDHYVLTKSSNSASATNSVTSNYFYTLETTKKLADQNGVPLNNIMLSIPHYKTGINAKYYRDPTEAELRWQVTVDQTFGADSIVYYSYMTTGSDEEWTYGEGLVSRAGVKQPKYEYAKTVNNQAQAWAHVYKNFKWQKAAGIRQSGSSSYDLFTKMQTGFASGNISGFSAVSAVTADRHVLLSEFKDGDGRMGYMLTNATDPASKFTATSTVKFGGAYKAALIYEKGAARVIELNASGEAQVILEPGEGKFLIPLGLK